MMSEGNESERARFLAWLEQKVKRAPIASILVTHHGRAVDRFELEQAEPTETFASRIWQDLEADASALGGEGGPETYMALLFRDGASEPEATRPLRLHSVESDPVHFGGDGERAQSFRHSERFAQIMAGMSQGAMDRADRENDRLISRLQRIDDQRWEDLERARRVALEQGEIEVRKEEARTQAMFMEKAFEQLELLLPLFLSKMMGGDESPGGAVERRMVKDFLAALGEQERAQIFLLLDPMQKAALGGLLQGEISPQLESIALTRIMASLTTDQIHAIYDTCESPAQKLAFERLLAQQKKGLAYVAAQGQLARAGAQNGGTS